MKLPTDFIVLLERRRIRHVLAWILATVTLLGLQSAHAQTASSKIARDLQAVIDAPTTPKLSWALLGEP